MFRIVFNNVGSDITMKDYVAPVDSLPEAEIVALNRVRRVLGIKDIALCPSRASHYELVYKGRDVGSFTIISI